MLLTPPAVATMLQSVEEHKTRADTELSLKQKGNMREIEKISLTGHILRQKQRPRSEDK